MSARADVKPLTHWAIAKGYTLRFATRAPHEVTGALTRPTGEAPFRWLPAERTLLVADERITLNEYGWEIAP